MMRRIMELVSRKEAIARGLTRYFTGKPCKYGHISERATKQKICLECERERAKTRGKDPARREYARRYQVELRKTEHSKEWYKNYRADENTKQRRREREKLADNREKANKRRNKRYKIAPHVALERNRLYRAKRTTARPPWYEAEDCKTLYLKAQQYGMQVDHIVPLVSDLVCGLHCWHNLQLMHISENSRKGNREWPDMP